MTKSVAGFSMSQYPLKILVTIANFGTKNDCYLQQLLAEYRSMSHDVHVVVISNLPKKLGTDVEVRIEVPRGDPWSFPFVHKTILAERVDEFDLFIYSEDDTLITEKNINAFVEVQKALREDEIAGFMRWELGEDGQRHFSSVHGHFHWEPLSPVSRGQDTFARFTNDHSACYMLTRTQLKRAISSGGYLVEPHEGAYDLLVTAATDPYTQCGMRKMICISRISDFLLPHLPNKYVGQMGISESDFLLQLRALRMIAQGLRPDATLINGVTKAPRGRWSKSYYEPSREDVLEMIPRNVRTVLSYGCGCGELEVYLAKHDLQVTAIPLDSVIGICAEARNIEVIYREQENVLDALTGRTFDCVLLSNVLHLAPNPELLLAQLTSLLNSGGCVIATSPNHSRTKMLWQRVMRRKRARNPGGYKDAGFHRTNAGILARWFRHSHLAVRNVVSRLPVRYSRFRILNSILADDVTILAVKP